MTVLLRPADDADMASIGALHHRSRADAYAGLIPAETFEVWSADGLSQWWVERWTWEKDTHRMTVAEDGGTLIGFSYVGPSETEGAVELYGLHVAPERVGTGAGRQLMIEALRQMADFAQPRAVLWVLEDNPVARRFYERGGWTPDGATRTEPVNGHPLPQLRYAYPLSN
ncbi:GNAT family N-acetyltransferase [Actinoplanes sp. NBRC 101535]|uniref:GNAT family N-acetyltransferase n=1 Tax=Actinoplanes sp. NBRC 101535 TaxID=3032196 RepID=UPI0024A57189|nr:GNAT family N-acetyltransferase [Actinoplanes sp. NBRC 101535]GLY01111.1 N-acetyltransferase [Actinoplanes sp. NBRC 101535]